MENRRRIIVGIAAAVVAVCAVVLFLVIDFALEDDSYGRLPVYFYNASQGQLEAELRTLPQTDSYERIDAALQHFFNGPESASLTRVWPAYVNFSELFTRLYIEEGILVASFSDLYSEMSPVDAILFRSAFTLTMVGLPCIDGMKFRTPGSNGAEGFEWFESAGSIANNPFISPARRTAEEFTLYFVHESGEGIITTLYRTKDVDVHNREIYILEQLIERQRLPGILPLVPTETRVRDVLVELDTGIYVDFSPEFHSRFSGTSSQARMMLQSITHTMLENDGSNSPRRVFFLINSERWDEFHGVSDFNLSFTFDETMMLEFVAEEDETGEGE